jgi:replication factor A1
MSLTWNRGARGRGRPKGSLYSKSDIRLLEYLALISGKYEVDSDKFFGKIVEAWNQKKSVCDNLVIDCRRNFDSHAVFIITRSEKVVTQFRMPEHLLREKNPMRAFESSALIHKRRSKERDLNPTPIRDLKAGMRGVHVIASVLKLLETREVLTRFGSYARVTNAIINDETGNIKLTLWNKQIDMVSLGDRIAIDNAKVVWFRGEPQLTIGRRGELRVIESEGDLS